MDEMLAAQIIACSRAAARDADAASSHTAAGTAPARMLLPGSRAPTPPARALSPELKLPRPAPSPADFRARLLRVAAADA